MDLKTLLKQEAKTVFTPLAVEIYLYVAEVFTINSTCRKFRFTLSAVNIEYSGILYRLDSKVSIKQVVVTDDKSTAEWIHNSCGLAVLEHVGDFGGLPSVSNSKLLFH